MEDAKERLAAPPLTRPTVPIRIGCAGWTIRTDCSGHFPDGRSHLERYAARFNAVEINSTFHRAHRPATFARWAESVPSDFRFSVKAPKAITHVRKLVAVGDLWHRFLGEISGLGPKLGAVLIQTPGSLVFSPAVGGSFFDMVRSSYGGALVFEARHASWAVDEAASLLSSFTVGRVVADPPLVGGGDVLDGPVAYHRLHGFPRVYHSSYEDPFLDDLNAKLRAEAARGLPAWCIFDNTARGAATGDAIRLTALIAGSGG
jgi:uncharacterized protein YecE (DUF72 family)